MSPPASLDPLLDLTGRRALVTGASLGIGASVARLLGGRGARVALHHAQRVDAALGHPGAGAALEADLTHLGVDVVRIDEDLAVAGGAARTAARAAASMGGVDILVLCASIQLRQNFAAIDAAGLDEQVQVNLVSTLAFVQSVLPGLKAQRHGRIVAIGSVNQVRPHAELLVYAALKAAQHTLVLGVAREGVGFGITANTVSPGLVATPRNAWRRKDAAEWAQIERSANPMQRAGTPQEVAQMVALLAAPAGAFVTGAEIAMDGGARL